MKRLRYRTFYFNRFCTYTKLMQRLESSVFILQLRTFKVGFSGPKTFLDFEKRATDNNFHWIFSGSVSEFTKHPQETGGLPYDFHSIMHYTRKHFSKNDRNTVEAIIDPSMQLGDDDGFSALDVVRVNQLYSCPQLKTNCECIYF